MTEHLTPASAAPALDPALRPGALVGAFKIQRIVARSTSAAVYLAADQGLSRPVALQEFLPARIVRRAGDGRLTPLGEAHEDAFMRGRLAFIAEARMLAHCEHAALVRVLHLIEANGTAYRVMPFYEGRRLTDARRDADGPPSEAALRSLLGDLLGALDALHASGQVHGGIKPANILLLDDGRPLLLGPGAASAEVDSDLVASLMANLTAPPPTRAAGAPWEPPNGVVGDLCALAEVARFWIIGATAAPAMRTREPLAQTLMHAFAPDARPHYSPALLSALDAADSLFAADWPHSSEEFRAWLDHGAPQAPPAPAAPALPEPAVAAPEPEPEPGPAIVLRPEPKPLDPPPPPPTPVPEAIVSDGALVGAAAPRHARAAPRRGRDLPSAPPAPPAPPTLPPPTPSRVPPVAAAAAPSAASVAAPVPPVPAVPPRPTHTPAAAWAALAAATPLPARATPLPPPFEIPDRLPPPAPAPRRRATAWLQKLLLSAALAVAGVVILAVTTGAWHEAPLIRLDAPPAAQAERPAEAPPERAAPVAAAPRPQPPADPPRAEPAPAAPPAPTAAVAAVAAPPAAAEPVKAPVAEAPRPDPRPPAVARAPAPLPAPKPPPKRDALVARAPTSPGAVCAGKTDFARYRCMQQQCEAARWYVHPQCVRLRHSDQAD